MISDFFDAIGSKATAIAIIYPIAVALYAVGFFWSLPSDIIGFFDIGAFLFKASIVYLSAISFLLLFFALMALVYAPVMERISEVEGKDEVKSADTHETPWSEFSRKRKFLWGGIVLFLLASIGWVILVDPPALTNGLDGLVLFFSVVFYGGLMLRPFISDDVWKTGKVLFLGAFAFLLPILVGQSDAQPENGAPVLSHDGQECPIIYVTSDLTVADCGLEVAIALPYDDEVRVWRKNTKAN